MWQHEILGEVLFEIPHGFRQGLLFPTKQIMFLRILTDQYGQLHVFHLRQQPWVPKRGAFRPRWKVARLSFARVAESHRNQSDLPRVIECFLVYPQPVPKVVSAFIVPRNARSMDLGTRSLPNNYNSAFGVGGQDGIYPKFQVRSTDHALLYFRKEVVHGVEFADNSDYRMSG